MTDEVSSDYTDDTFLITSDSLPLHKQHASCSHDRVVVHGSVRTSSDEKMCSLDEENDLLLDGQLTLCVSDGLDGSRPLIDTQGGAAFYSQSSEQQETVKCFVSSCLFLAVVLAVFIVAIAKNPDM